MNKLALRASIGALVLASSTAFAAPTIDDLWETIQKQQKQIEALKKEQQETEEKVGATAEAIDSGAIGSGSKAAEWASKTRIGGYGEHHYNNYDNGSDKSDQIDAHRYVLFIGHEYSDTVRFFSEFELEHGFVGEGEPGEVELEQAFIEWDFAPNHSVVAGQFLVPVGILNETHEPDTFYGVERNLVEKNIIPATWWETGAMVQGEIAPGLSYNVAYHSGLALSDGDSSIRSGRQKSAKANASDFALTTRVKYTGINGLELSATLQRQENLTQGSLTDASAMLSELHAIYNIDMFSVRALWASWNVDGNAFELAGADEQNGWYLEPSIKPLDNLGFFVRYSSYNKKAGSSTEDDTKTFDVGVNYWLHPRVVFKADLHDVKDSEDDSFNLGVGWSF